MRGHLGPACNAVGYVDRQVWGIEHLYSQPVWIRLKVSTYYERSKKNLLKNWLNCMHLLFLSIFLAKLVGLHI